MNKAESASMEMILREHGWQPSEDTNADLVILNTCTVRTTAENRAWSRIHQLAARKKERPFTLAVMGCMAEQYRDAMKKKAPGIDYVFGTFQKQAFGLMLDLVSRGERLDHIEESPSYVFGASHHEPGAFRSFLPIMHGCNNFCTYCIVPHVRGREVSRDPASIIAEIDKLEELGVREVTLLGQNVNSYRWQTADATMDFPALLAHIAQHLHEKHRDSKDAGGAWRMSPSERGDSRIGWIRFLTSHPKDLSDRLIEVMASEPLLCRHIHLPVQSGSNAVLARMNRRYTREYYLDLTRKLRTSLPGLTLSTDILVGFPGETEEDLEQTLQLMREVRFSYSFMYHFNVRSGTPAASMPDRIPEKTKKMRLARVIALQKEITASLMQERVGQVDEVLIEDVSRRSKSEVLARTARDEMVVFAGDSSRIGQFAKVRLISIAGHTFRGEEVRP